MEDEGVVPEKKPGMWHYSDSLKMGHFLEDFLMKLFY